MRYVEKNLSSILIVLLALAMIAWAIWFFERRIAKIERRMRPAVGYLQRVQGHFTGRRISN
jgi:hypothetical protein